MRQWNGLLQKEWITMGNRLYGTVGAALLFTILIPFGSTLFNGGLSELELSLGFSMIWIFVSMIIPIRLLLVSVGKEKSRPDVWLHSSASVYKLFGAKAVFAGFVGVVNMVIPFMVILNKSKTVDYLLDFTFSVIIVLFVTFYLLSLLAMCLGLFFSVIYQVIKPIVGQIALLIVVVFFFSLSWIVEKIRATAVYEKISSIGQVKGPGAFNITQGNATFEMDAIVFSPIDISLHFLLAVILFVTAAILFEKKIRL